MHISSSSRLWVDQCVPNQLEPHVPIDSLTQIQHFKETSSPSSSSSSYSPSSTALEWTQPACTTILNQGERTQYPKSPLPPPNNQPLDYFHNSSQEPTPTDPVSTKALWEEVSFFVNDYYPPYTSEIDIMAHSPIYDPNKKYDPQAFPSTAFSELLKQHQITENYAEISGDIGNAQIWLWFRELVERAPVAAISELEDCSVWNDNVAMKADADKLAAGLEALFKDHDLNEIDRQQFFTGQVLRRCALPGFKVHSSKKVLDVAAIPYRLLPKRESHTGAISTVDSAKALARPGKDSKRKVPGFSSTNPSSIERSQSASKIVAEPENIIVPELNLPSDKTDCAYWLNASEFRPIVQELSHLTFVSIGAVRKTSPYLSIVSENSDYFSVSEKKVSVYRKMIIYGSTALYNRRLLYIRLSRMNRQNGSSIIQVERSACDIHFGLALVDEDATLYVFQCEEIPKEGKQDNEVAWHGCSMSKVGQWDLTEPTMLADMLDRLRTIADWVKRVYMPALQHDFTQLSNNSGFR